MTQGSEEVMKVAVVSSDPATRSLFCEYEADCRKAAYYAL